ncbi:MAG: hypothetical protein J5608_02415 [Alphaproteobacteria bacterium]|nr:hypothetical protein [Alphaproteobacteria bacterium]
MKKYLIGIAGVMAMVSMANAESTSKIKAACMASGKTVWVEQNKTCVPINPCTSATANIKETYCMQDVRLPRTKAEAILDKYVDKVLKSKVDNVKFTDDDFAMVTTKKGGYFVVRTYGEYTDYSVSPLVAAAFWAYGHGYDETPIINATASECLDVQNFANELHGRPVGIEYRPDEKTCSYHVFRELEIVR